MKVQELIDIVQKGLQELANGNVDAFLDNLLPVMAQIVPKAKQKFGADDLQPVISNLLLKAAESLSETELQQVGKNITEIYRIATESYDGLSSYAAGCTVGLLELGSSVIDGICRCRS